MISYPAIEDDNFENILANKLEFRYLESKEGLFEHQERVRRYISPYTPYKNLLIFHGTGTGKTFICTSISDDHYEELGMKTLVITRGETGKQSYILQIAEWIKKSKNIHKVEEIKKYINERYDIEKQGAFINKLIKSKLKNVKEIYDNRIVILDEAHNIGIHKSLVKKKKNYETIQTFFRMLTKSKIIIMTATPMVDGTEKISPMLNLILPESKELKIRKEINKEEFIRKGKGLITKHMERKETAEILEKNIVKCEMIGIQKETYIKTLEVMKQTHISREITHASLFSSSEGLYGPKLFKKILEKVTVKKETRLYEEREAKTITYKYYRIKPEYESEVMINNLEQHSSKYFQIINSLRKNTNMLSFIFIEEVEGSGLILLSAILLGLGYSHYNGESYDNLKPERRMTICTGKTDISPNIDKRIAGFNDPRNKKGDYIQVIIGSRIVGEAITLMNIRFFHCAMPHWNNSIIDQALGRTIRTYSHQELEEEDRNISINIYVATLPEYKESEEESIDIKKLIISKRKENNIKKIEELLDVLSIERITTSPINMKTADTTTFCCYYLHKTIKSFINWIKNIVINQEIRDVEMIYEMSKIPANIVLETLYFIISRNIPIHTENNKKIFLRETMGRLFLTKDPERKRNSYIVPIKIIKKGCYEPIENNFDKHRVSDLIEKCKNVTKNKIIEILQKESWKTRVEFVEKAIELYLDKENDIAEIFYNSIIIYNNDIYHVYEYRSPTKGSYNTTARQIIPNCLTKKLENGWKFIGIEEEITILEKYRENVNKLENSLEKYGIYATKSTIDGILRIREKECDKVKDGRKVNRGRNIKTLNKSKILQLIKSLEPETNDLIANHNLNMLEYYLEKLLIKLDLIVYI